MNIMRLVWVFPITSGWIKASCFLVADCHHSSCVSGSYFSTSFWYFQTQLIKFQIQFMSKPGSNLETVKLSELGSSCPVTDWDVVCFHICSCAASSPSMFGSLVQSLLTNGCLALSHLLSARHPRPRIPFFLPTLNIFSSGEHWKQILICSSFFLPIFEPNRWNYCTALMTQSHVFCGIKEKWEKMFFRPHFLINEFHILGCFFSYWDVKTWI